MTRSNIRDVLVGLASGECRYVGDRSIHVYCRAPMVLELQPTGRRGWRRGPATYQVVTPTRDHTPDGWMGIDAAVAIVLGELQTV
jgi:hypothetical protein